MEQKEMKNWTMPKLEELEIKTTEFGTVISSDADASWSDGSNNWYSFSN